MTKLMNQRVDFEVCDGYRSPIEHDEPVCASCGYLADDHGADASVLWLPCHPVTAATPAYRERKAS